MPEYYAGVSESDLICYSINYSRGLGNLGILTSYSLCSQIL